MNAENTKLFKALLGAPLAYSTCGIFMWLFLFYFICPTVLTPSLDAGADIGQSNSKGQSLIEQLNPKSEMYKLLKKKMLTVRPSICLLFEHLWLYSWYQSDLIAGARR